MKHVQIGPIKDFALGIYDGPHATPKEADEGPVFLGIKNVTPKGTLDLSEIRHVSEQDYPMWTKRVVPQKNDIVFSYEATLHLYALIPDGFCGCLGRRMALVRPDPTQVHPRFLLYYFLTTSWRKVVESNIINGATVDRIPLKKFPEFKVQFPALDAQERIASILSAYDDLIENNRRRIQLLEQAARLLYREWFVRLHFPGHEHVKIKDGVPEEWEIGTIADLGQIITGKTPSTKTPDNFGGNIPFVKTPDMHRSRIIVETEDYLSEKGAATQPKKTLPVGTILVACIGAKLGVVSITSHLCQTNQQINAVVPWEDYMTHYSLFVLIDIKPRLEALGGGATMPNVNKTKFASIPILMPSTILLREFEEFAKAVFQQIKLLCRQNLCLVHARDLLLPRLMNGEVIV